MEVRFSEVHWQVSILVASCCNRARESVQYGLFHRTSRNRSLAVTRRTILQIICRYLLWKILEDIPDVK